MLTKSEKKAAAKIRPLRDRVVVKPLKYKHDFLFVAGIELRKGLVVAIGPGRRIRRRIPWKLPYEAHAEGKSVNPAKTFYVEDGPETGKIAPMMVKVGDVVEYGFRDTFPFRIDGEYFLMINQKNIYGTTDAKTDSGVLEPVSAAID